MRQSLFLCYFRQHGGNLESSPVFVFPLDEQQPEQLPQQLAVPLNRPRIWWMKYATAMMTTIATIMVAGLIDIPPLGLAIIRCEINLSGPLGHLQPALRFGNRPVFPCGQPLTGQKGPMRGGSHWPLTLYVMEGAASSLKRRGRP